MPLENTEQQLRDCLICELKVQQQKKRKRPWFALMLVILLFVGIGYYFVQRWQTNKVTEHVSQINAQPGIIVTKIEILGLHRIGLTLLRDPSSVAVEKWLSDENILSSNLVVNENAYLSLAPSMVKVRLLEILQAYPQLDITWQNEMPIIAGELKNFDKLRLQNQLDKLAGLNNTDTLLDQIKVTELGSGADDSPEIMRAILDLNVVKVDNAEVEFTLGSRELSEHAIEQLTTVAENFKVVIDLAEKQGLAVGLIIMGASDSIGTKSFNQALSQQRANVVKLKLQEMSIGESRLNAIGLGIIELKSAGTGVRKVLFNVVYFDAN